MVEEPREYFWGCELTKENPKTTWTFQEEEEDSDFLVHTLFLKQAVLGQAAVKDERNIVTVTTKNFDNEEITLPVLSLTLGRNDMCLLDLSFGHDNPVVFELAEGTGPVCLTAQQLVELPNEGNLSQDDSCTEEDEELLEKEEFDEKPVKAKKRKASSSKGPSKSKKGKMEPEDEDMEDEEEEDDDEEEEEEEDSEEEESSPEKVSKKKKKAKEVPKAAASRKGGKATKASPGRTKSKKTKKA